MEFIMTMVVVAICVTGTYRLFELYARRKERMALIEKIGDQLDASSITGKIIGYNPPVQFRFGALKASCLLIGVGLGLFIAFIIDISVAEIQVYDSQWIHERVLGTLYGASVLLFGGIGLLTAFIIELKMSKKSEEKD
ncbi:MAG: hypothetical protein LBJ58_07200 [Tannerellaceae bacterium]|jgi:hypothetical protein|nr:hypothetical protein [Tannerellaceae bacterium]